MGPSGTVMGSKTFMRNAKMEFVADHGLLKALRVIVVAIMNI
jgi:hypothetical protein